MASVVERFERMPREGVDPGAGLELRRGSNAGWEDYLSLSRFHYRAARPATVCEVLVLADSDGGGPSAVLVVSRPTLNAWWRGLAWPGEFDGMEKREAARAVNEKLRTISRVIVDPRFRGIGLATQLVEAYLARPLTAMTEAVGTMSRACPFFERAGMTARRRGRSRRELRLQRVLREEGMSWDALIAGRVEGGRVARALRVWAEASRGTRAMRDVREIGRAAAAGWRFPPVAYTAGELCRKAEPSEPAVNGCRELEWKKAPQIRGTAAEERGDGSTGSDSGRVGAAHVVAGEPGC